MTQAYFDQRWCAPHGIGRFATELQKRLPELSPLDMQGCPTSPLDAIRLAKHLRRRSARGYFSPGFNVPAWAACPVITTIHDLIHVHFPAERSLAKSAYYRFIQRPIIRRSPVTLTVSQYSRQQIIRWYGLPESRVVCVGNGISQDFKPDGPQVELPRPFFLYVGNSKPHKNVDVLLRAMMQLRKRHEAALVMVTKSDLHLETRISALGLTDDVLIVSGLDDTQLATYYRGATALVLPSHYEGFGLPLVEAMACGCPAIGANCTSIPEVLHAAGVTFDPDQPAELAAQMERLLSDCDHRHAVVQKGLSRAADFSWDSVARRVRDAITPHLC